MNTRKRNLIAGGSAVAIAVVVALSVAGYASINSVENASNTETTTTGTPGSTVESTKTPSTVKPTFNSTPSQNPRTTSVSAPPSQAMAYLKDVRIDKHESDDRIVFEFDSEKAPGYSIRYEAEGAPSMEGGPVRADGEHQLVLEFDQASGVDLTGGVNELYKGPSEFLPANTSQVVQLKRVYDFEARMSWVAGVKTQSKFEVFSLQNPTRLVIDISA